MISTLEFLLPEEEAEYRVAVDGHRWRMVVEDMDDWLRSLDKYTPKEQWPEMTPESLREKLYELCQERRIVIGED